MSFVEKLGFGCVALSTHLFEHNAVKLLNNVFDQGITHFDTAPLYGRGYSEKIIGKFLKTNRKAVTITTKFGLPVFNNVQLPTTVALPLNFLKNKLRNRPISENEFRKPNLLEFRKIDLKEIKFNFENSLKNLDTDYIDNYLLHEALPSFITDEGLGYILSLKSKGIVKNIGIAASYPNIDLLKLNNIIDWDILQYENSLLHPSENFINNFPNKKHIYHSILKPLKHKTFLPNLKNDIAGILLARATKLNPNGKSIFASMSINHINHNLKVADAYNKYSLDEINNILINAIY